ncbi:unnamed protein product [Heligmosomoides polygyrus]|uniref:Uncharacterized protein n=1 Tax=Heligmosomoides polygyrus TaxID=6339 RepID=A0A183GGS4_HELPZ|nr:unnamed protein product [Heligmosomoides polygyrus]
MPLLTKSSSSSLIRNGLIDGGGDELCRSSSLKPSKASALLARLRRHTSKPEITDDEPPPPLVEQSSSASRQRVQVGEGVKALLASRRGQKVPDALISPIKRLKRSLSARLLGDHNEKRLERRYRSFAIKKHREQSSAGSSPL